MTWLGEQLGRIADDMPERDLGARAIEIHQRRRRNTMALAAAAVVVVIVLAATVGVRALPAEPRAAARPSSPPELSQIKVGVVATVESAPVYVALSRGYFKEEGLTVEPVVVTGAPASVPMVKSGFLDLTQTDYTSLFRANEMGDKLKIVSSLHQAAPGSLVIAVNAKSKIRTVSDLKGKKIAVANLKGHESLALEAVLKRAGLSQKDVTEYAKPDQEMINALDHGQVDAALLAEPFVTLGRETKHTRMVADAMTGEFANLYTAGMMATDQWTRLNPRTLAAFQRALAKAQHLIASDPRQVRAALPRYTKIFQATADAATLGSYPAKLDPAELQRVADLALAYKWLKHPTDFRSAVVMGG